MVLINFCPDWFFGYGIAMELLFAVVSFTVAMFAYKIYKKSGEKNIKLFGTAFLLISISYMFQTLINFAIVSKLNEHVCTVIKVSNVSSFNYVGMMLHIVFMSIGLATLFYTTLKIKKQRVLWFLILGSLLMLFTSDAVLIAFYLLSTLFLLFIVGYHSHNCFIKRKAHSMLIGVAFLFLLIGNVQFLFAENHQISYVVGHFLELFAYLLISFNLYMVIRKNEKKRKA